MNGNVFSENGISPTLLTNKGEGIKIGTWRTHEDGKGFRPTEDNNCPTIPARAREDGSGQPVIKIGAIRGRNPNNPLSRVSGLPTEQMLEINENGTSNALTTVQKDNVVVIGFQRTEEAKIKRKESIRKGKDTGSFSDREMVLKEQDYSDTILAGANPKKEGLILIPTNNSKGFDKIEEEEDSINFSNPNSETRRGRIGKKVAQTLDTACNQGIYTQQRIRRLTPLECFKLMDFNFGIDGIPDFIWNVSDSQAYKQAGNSICVGVLVELIKKLNI
jgi:DNA (cytosine-5)-methyltransferase 1